MAYVLVQRYITGQVDMFVTNQLASWVDNTDKLYLIGTDIAIPSNHVQIENAPVYKLENVLANIKTFQLSQ